MKVKDAMHKGAEWVPPTTTVVELAKLMVKHDIGAIPIGENDKLIGMVTDRDIVCRGFSNGKDISKLTARDVMTPNIVWCRDDEDLDDATRIMENKKVRRLPVIDENKRMVGMLSLGDVSHAGKSKLSGEVLQAVSAHHK
jgi:CBS domain-containing protein